MAHSATLIEANNQTAGPVEKIGRNDGLGLSALVFDRDALKKEAVLTDFAKLKVSQQKTIHHVIVIGADNTRAIHARISPVA